MLSPRQPVKIVSGPLAGQNGNILEVDHIKGRVWILLPGKRVEILGVEEVEPLVLTAVMDSFVCH